MNPDRKVGIPVVLIAEDDPDNRLLMKTHLRPSMVFARPMLETVLGSHQE